MLSGLTAINHMHVFRARLTFSTSIMTGIYLLWCLVGVGELNKSQMHRDADVQDSKSVHKYKNGYSYVDGPLKRGTCKSRSETPRQSVECTRNLNGTHLI